MPPTLQELEFAIRLLAKTVDEVDDKIVAISLKVDGQHDGLSILSAKLTDIDNKLQLLPLVLAKNVEPLIEKRTTDAFEDVRRTLDELRNKLWAIKSDVEHVRQETGQHLLPSREMLAQWDRDKEEKEDEKEGLVKVTKGKFSMVLPMTEGTLRVLKILGIILLAVLGTGATAGGVWALIDRIRHAIAGGG